MKGYPILAICLVIFSTAFISAMVSADDTTTVRVGVYENEPLIFTDENGTAKGVYADILEYVALEEGWKIEYVHGTWDECLTRLENGSIDIMPDIAYTEERSKIYDYTNETVLVNWGQLYVQKESEIQSFPDLEGKKIAVVTNDVYNVGPRGIRKLIEEFDINCTFVEVREYADALESVENKSADAGVVNRLYGMKFENKYEIDRSPIIFSPIELRFAFPKNASMNPYLIGRIDHHMKELKEDGNSIYYQSINKYLGGESGKETVEVFPGWTKNALLVGSGVLLFLLATSIISRVQVKRKTAELKKSKEKFERSFMNNPEAAVYMDADSNILDVNSRFTELFDYSLDEVKGENINSILVPEDKMEEAKMLDKKVEEGCIYHDTVRKKKDEALIPVSVSTAPIKIEGQLVGSVVLYKDITDRKVAEEKIRALNDTLRLINKIMRHDILNDLQIASSSIEIYSEKKDEKFMEKSLERINKSIRLIELMREFESMVSSGKELEEYRVKKVVEDITKDYDVKFNVNGDCTIKADNAFRSVIDNIVRNAVVHGKTDKVDITMENKGNECEIRIADYGVGISNEIKKKIFEEHFSYGETGGTGLGLYIAKKTIERYGGRIHVEDNEPGGTVFVITYIKGGSNIESGGGKSGG